MPRGRPARRAVVSSESESDSEVQVSQSASQSQRPTQSQRTKQSQKLSQTQKKGGGGKSQKEETEPPANFHDYVAKAVKIALHHAVTKLPIKQAELTNQAMNGEHRLTSRVIAKAKELLQSVYQLDLVELKSTSTKQYICVGTHPALTSEEYTDQQQQDMGILFLILEYIYMKNGEVTDKALFEYLSRFDIFLDENHEVFGDVKTLIFNFFSKQKYLSFKKHVVEGSTVEKVTVHWGERAIHEFMKREMLDFVAESLDCNPTVFLQQYEEAYGTEIDAEELEHEISNLVMSSQPSTSQATKSKSRSRQHQRQQVPTEEMEVDSESD